ncbi:hypothetical protein AG1IA_09135 [Rhizoctonia solani AG-1 IA]|uniref:Uncharacterized protein n=1 Tax=Thanatephorus cucumeris (strain AG1-IA) TaxID=983506 RepID=L8WF90_THACA|nr:hypothetical protein AG1IA_09135 [Rhizoctonia solani AG-1 IA]
MAFALGWVEGQMNAVLSNAIRRVVSGSLWYPSVMVGLDGDWGEVWEVSLLNRSCSL